MGSEDENAAVESKGIDLPNEHDLPSDLQHDGWYGNAPPPAARIKVLGILAACKESCNGDHLRKLATATDGLINDEVRRVACTSTAALWDAQRSTCGQGLYCLDMR